MTPLTDAELKSIRDDADRWRSEGQVTHAFVTEWVLRGLTELRELRSQPVLTQPLRELQEALANPDLLIGGFDPGHIMAANAVVEAAQKALSVLSRTEGKG
jgi:hypothetical protein